MNESVISFVNAQIFQNNNLVLKNINLSILQSELVYLIGKTGSGKSSLLKTLYGELPLQEGQGFIAGFSLQNLKSREIPFLRRKLGIVFQDFQLLYDRTAFQNLEFVMKATGWDNKKKIEEKIAEVLEKVGLQTKSHKMPHQLSGGEQQRLGIARALVNNPTILLADEPTGNLDPETTSEILQLMLKINEGGCCMIIATHDYTLFEMHNSRTLKCDQGELIDSALL